MAVSCQGIVGKLWNLSCDLLILILTCVAVHIYHLLLPTIMRSIPSSDHAEILFLLSNNQSIRQVAQKTGHSKSTIHRIQQTLELDKENIKLGGPCKLSPRDKRKIIHKITSGEIDTAVQATKWINNFIESPVSTNTVRRALHSEGLKSAPKVKKPLLKSSHRRARLDFALKYQYWTVDDWKRVLWSDETKINKFGSDGRQWVWKRRGEPLSDRTTQPTVKHGGGNIMVWGCFSYHGVGQLAEVEGRMKADQYISILEDHLLSSAENAGILRADLIFQQDNDPKHTSKLAQKWFDSQGIHN